MKTAVSIPDDTFEKGELLAKKLGLSRSALYARALDQLVAQQGAIDKAVDQGEDPITAQVNAFWKAEGIDKSKLDPWFKKMRARGLAAGGSDW